MREPSLSELVLSAAKVIEIIGCSPKSFDDATIAASTKRPKDILKNLKTIIKFLKNFWPLKHLATLEEKKNRKKFNKNKNKSKSRESIKYAKGNAELWLIVTSIEHCKDLALKVVNIYKKRMQIEENIRDTKSQYGFRLNESLTRTPESMSILLLIAAIASLLCWLAGILAKKWQLGAKFQAASSKFTCKISVVFLGKEVLKMKMTKKDFLLALKMLRSIALQMPHEVS